MIHGITRDELESKKSAKGALMNGCHCEPLRFNPVEGRLRGCRTPPSLLTEQWRSQDIYTLTPSLAGYGLLLGGVLDVCHVDPTNSCGAGGDPPTET